MKNTPLNYRISALLCAGCFLLITMQCTVNKDEKTLVDAKSELPSIDRKPGFYPDTVRVYDIVVRYPNSSWKDLEHYYRFDIPKYHAGKDYTNNLRKFVIMNMVYNFKMTENADKPTLAFYVEEQTQLPIPDAKVMIACLEGLRGYWPDARLRQVAENSCNKLVQYIQDNFKEPGRIMQQNKTSFDLLKNYAAVN